ncbi:MAG TPA: hypothetical protein VMI33_17920 [Streptosporangiaceae bacterium]|nr:hypothetical protein [Streptosporangiaceae bacterium]
MSRRMPGGDIWAQPGQARDQGWPEQGRDQGSPVQGRDQGWPGQGRDQGSPVQGRDQGWPGQGRDQRRRGGRRPQRRGSAARGAAACVAAALAMAGAGAASAMAATPAAPSWHIVKRVRGGALGDFTAAVAVGRNGGWAFDGVSRPTAWHRSGTSWDQVSFPGRSGDEVVAAGASSASNVWAFTDRGARARALRWNGSQWSVQGSFPGQIGGAVVLSASDVWAFGEPTAPGRGLGAWHYNGREWARVASGRGLEGGSGLSARDIWAFAGTDVARWNGRTWTRTSVAGLLPARQPLNDPAVVGIDALGPGNIYAIGNGNLEDEGGPTVILHYNGHSWRKVAQGNFGAGTSPLQQVTSDGRGGLWIPMPGFGGRRSYLVHYSAGRLTAAALPVRPSRIDVQSVSRIPGTTDVLGGGFTHTAGNPGTGVVAVILEYEG